MEIGALPLLVLCSGKCAGSQVNNNGKRNEHIGEEHQHGLRTQTFLSTSSNLTYFCGVRIEKTS